MRQDLVVKALLVRETKAALLALVLVKRVAQAVVGQAQRFDVFSKLKHRNFPGGAWLRTPSLVLGTLYHRLRDHF